jgi:hypothetical protein
MVGDVSAAYLISYAMISVSASSSVEFPGLVQWIFRVPCVRYKLPKLTHIHKSGNLQCVQLDKFIRTKHVHGLK